MWGVVQGGDETRAVRGWWVLATLAPFGLGSGPAFWYAGRRAGQPAWERAGWFWFGASLLGYLGALFTKHFWSVAHPFALGEMFVAWAGAVIHALAIREEYVRRVHAVGSRVERSRQARLDAREARRIAREEPRLARELGIGRPDRRGAYDGGLVDVNHAPAGALEELPGVGPALAERITAARAQAAGFASVDELGELLELDGATVERIRERAVFLP